MLKNRLNIVFHTHWDREWYFPFETYRYRLIEVVKRIIDALENDEIPCFVLDGQSLPILDFLELAEEDSKKRFIKLIKEEKIIIGPWYIAMDEFLVSGESIIRNLARGHEIASQFGKVQKLGYIPDTFGHIGQMPQILKGFGIENAMMWRGVLPKKDVFFWEGVDGSKLFTIFLSAGYYQFFLNEDNPKAGAKLFFDTVTKFNSTNELLLTSGGDHLMPTEKNISSVLDKLKTEFSLEDIKITNFENYFKLLKQELDESKIEVIKGELRNNEHIYILPNVLSTRSYLKVLNQQLEDEMVGFIEPFAAYCHLFDDMYPNTYIKSIWDEILKNQPHDSICGCSHDDVHKENEMRALTAFQRIDALKRGLMRHAKMRQMSSLDVALKNLFDEDDHFSLYNPNPYHYNGVVEIDLFLKNESHYNDGFTLKTNDQGNIKVNVLNVSDDRLFDSPIDIAPAFKKGKRYKISFFVKDIKATSITNFSLVKGTFNEKSYKEIHEIENNILRVSLEKDGKVTILNKKSGQFYQNQLNFLSELDQGDSYNYSKPDHDIVTYAKLEQTVTITKTDDLQELKYRLYLIQPKGLSINRNVALAETVKSTIDVTLRLYENESFLRVQNIIEQNAKDQRLKVCFELPELFETHASDTAFEIVKRISNRNEHFIANKQKEVPVVVDPSLSMIHLNNENSGFYFAHRGLHEFQIKNVNEKTKIDVTLIRSVSHLSLDHLNARGGGAGPSMETPDAQAISTQIFNYCFGLPFINDNEAYQNAKTFRQPIRFISGLNKDDQLSLFELDNKEITLSSLRKSGLNQIEVRLVNLSDNIQKTSILSDLQMISIHETRIDGTFIKVLPAKIEIKPYEIKTLLLTYKKDG